MVAATPTVEVTQEQETVAQEVLPEQEQGVEEQTAANTEVESEEEVAESQVPFNLANVPLTEEEPASAEPQTTEDQAAKETTPPTAQGPPQSEIEEPVEAPEALPIPEPPINTENSGALINSLDGLPATSFLAGMDTVSKEANNVQTQEQVALSESMPEIEQPTGLPTKGSKELAAYQPKKGDAPDLKAKEGGREETVAEEHESDLAPIPKQVTPKIKPPGSQDEEQEEGSWWSRMFSFVSANISSIKTEDEGVNTSAGPRPKVDTSGAADPAQNNQNRAEADTSVTQEQAQADLNTTEYRGEEEIYPEIEREMLSPNVELTALEDREPQSVDELLLTPEVKAAVDLEAQAQMDAEAKIEIEKNRTEYETYQEDTVKEKEATNTEIEEETAKAKADQERSQNDAKAEVNTERENWKKDNEGVKEDYNTKSDEERKKVDGDIDGKIAEADRDVETEYSGAEKDAEEKKRKANEDAAKEKKKAEEKEKDRGFWGSISDAIGDFFDAIREAINDIFDALREGVKFLIEQAKKAVNALIDLARDAIVGFIKAFGEALKGFVSVALAAFPELRDKALGAIDKAVEVAVDVVNTLAEGLKEIANALLDALGAVLDAILAAYQAIYNLVLDALEFLTKGLIQIIAFISNLVAGAWYAPGEFFGALATESLGGDPSEPLPNFEVPKGQEEDWAIAMGKVEEKVAARPTADVAEGAADQVKELLNKPEFSDDDVAIDPFPAVEMDQVLINQLADLKEGETYDLGGAGENAVTTEQFKNAAADEMGIDLESETDVNAAPVSETTEDVEAAAGEDAVPDPDWRNMKDQEKLDHHLAQMLTEVEQTAAEEPKPTQEKPEAGDAGADAASLITKTGRLDVGQRLAFMGEQMLTGIQVLWNNYKGWIIAGLVTALLAAGIIAFFTGGAGLVAVIQVIGQALIIIFGAIAVARAMGSLWDYVKAAWAGDPQKAGKDLATAVAIIVVEFFLDKILLGMGKVFKRILKATKAVMKTTKTGTKVLKGLNTVRKGATKVVSKGKSVLRKGVVRVKNSKLVVRMQGVAGKGIKRFNKFRDDILDRFGFKRIWVEKHGKYIELWGEFNSKILLMKDDGDVEPVELSDAQKKHFGKDKQIGQKLDDPNLADDVRVDGDHVVVSNSFEERFNRMSADDKAKSLDKLKSDDFSVRRQEALKGGRPDFDETAKIKTKDIDSNLQKPVDSKKIEDAVDTNLSNRSKKVKERDVHPKGTDEYNKLNKKVIDESEEIGTKALDTHAEDIGLGKPVHSGDGAYTVDKIYLKDGKVYVGEAKGGKSALGGKMTSEGFSQQGTRAYLKQTADDMIKSGLKKGDKELLKNGRAIKSAINKGDGIVYFMGRQKINPNGTLGAFEIHQFDI